ncbi:hypothetical protein F6476_13545 [Pseudomonas umsongensis]|uniref:hypothetical protein n=1 Tax=Pseudomonas umsongensis TaxID=198618 RepID=UPI001246B88B|nr:hypothetical protein [Pseudomonas umsongensis]QFG30140.1 hypothetical protein F6476_13545 [Pseudomonas umsongensis]
MRALLLLRDNTLPVDSLIGQKHGRAQFFESIMTAAVKLPRGIEMDKMLPSLNWRRSQRSLTFINDTTFENTFLHHLYDLPFDMYNNSSTLEENVFRRLIARVIRRTNEECRAQHV